MNYLQKKKLAFMSIVNRIKGFVRSVSGMPPLTLPDCVDNDSLINYTIKGNCVQDGTPTPDNPIEVESVGDYDEETRKYKIPVVCSGKNLFKIRTPDKIAMSAYLGFGETSYKMNDDGSYTISEYGAIGFDFNNLVAGEKYTVSCKFASTATMASGHYCFIGQNMYSGATGVKNARAYDVPNYIGKRLKLTFTADTTNLIAFAVGDCSDTTRVIITDIQLEEGSTATNYEPYVAPVTTNIYLDEPLRRATTWGYAVSDYIDFEKQKVVRRIAKRSLSSLSWVTEASAYAHVYTYPPLQFYGFRFQISDMLKTTRIGGYCNMFRVDADNNVSTKPYGMWIGVSGDRTCYFCLPEIYNAGSTDYERVSAFNEWMKERNPIEIYYILETAKETSVAIPELPMIKGTTIYTIKTSVQPSDMSATYYATSKE